MDPLELQLYKNPYLKQSDVPFNRFKKRLKSPENVLKEVVYKINYERNYDERNYE